MQTKWRQLQKGTGIKVTITGDIDEFGKQKYRPAIVIKSYPSHVKVQLLSTKKGINAYYKCLIGNKVSYVRPIYHVTISHSVVIHSYWFEKGKRIQINKKNVFFQKIIEMEYKEIFDKNLDFTKIKELEIKVQEQDIEIKQLKKQICMQSLKLKNRNHG
ncbi:hypothetical protein [Spiroplasma ixodetis]|uniref:hypothetical protein n=1 Tax=Spiroplasma ixodetis TaxID=2141 RepID=UPI002574F13B|nr:hypothetical protein [Spiroplasma ixodetis]WJG71335.1 hypothetical protein SIXOD_v1c27460 [Spiroplasma ixodetis Y32]